MLAGDQYRLLIEAAPTMVWRSGRDSKCDYFNATWLAFTGRTLEQELGDGWAVGVHPEDLQRCLDTYLTSFEARRSFEMEYRLRRHDGIHRWIHDRGVPFTVNGEFGGFIGSCIDIHERHESERAKTTFLSMLAHELRTPLQTLTLCNEYLQQCVRESQPPSSAVSQRIDRQLARLQALVDRASRGLEISRGLSTELALTEVDLVDLVRDAAIRHPARGAGGGATLVDPPVRHLMLRADPIQLSQVLDVLLSNAIKYSPGGSTVELRIELEHDRARILVDDEGIGIPPGDLERLGTPYFRGSNVSVKEHAGMGLGLTVAREIIDAHGGTLTLVPRSPVGTRAIVELPLPRGNEAGGQA